MALLHEQDEFSPLKSIARKFQMKKGIVSKSKIIASYIEEVKKDLMWNLDRENVSDISMASAGHNTDNEEDYLAGESQNIQSNEELGLDEYLKKWHIGRIFQINKSQRKDMNWIDWEDPTINYIIGGQHHVENNFFKVWTVKTTFFL